eukprot:3163417-Pyramimonas_sp.AAC.2
MSTDISFAVYRSGSVPEEVIEEAHVLDSLAFGAQFESVRSLLSSPSCRNRHLVVAAQRGAIVGILLYTATSLAAQVEKLIVKADCRRQGVGRALLNQVKERVGNRLLRLHVEQTNDAAIHLYATAGFKNT